MVLVVVVVVVLVVALMVLVMAVLASGPAYLRWQVAVPRVIWLPEWLERLVSIID